MSRPPDPASIQVERPAKVLFPADGVTKGDLVDYYASVAAVMVPLVAGRPVTMQRFPNGIDEPGFYQKEAPDYFPDWVRRVPVAVRGEGAVQPQVVCDDAATLVYLASQATVTPHVWLSRADDLDRPDRLVLDLDPPGEEFALARRAALELRDLLAAYGLTAFVMTTGSRGLHVVAPLQRTAGFDEVRELARSLAERLAEARPDRLTIAMRKTERKGRLFVDYLRNGYAQHGAAPYAVRARPGAPVATPVSWDELSEIESSRAHTLRTVPARVAGGADPWAGMADVAADPLEARRRLAEDGGGDGRAKTRLGHGG